jgi:nucleotide-binding universal stress UspA family protein
MFARQYCFHRFGETTRMLQHIVVAADETAASREAIRTALRWATRAGARVTVISVSEPGTVPALTGAGAGSAHVQPSSPALDSMQRWLLPELARERAWPIPETIMAVGIPNIEIARFADEASADLLVIGRKQRSPAARLLVGDTADAVARRSRVPCLFVPKPTEVPTSMLVALDGGPRGPTVLAATRGIAEALTARLELVTVEPAAADEPPELTRSLPTARTVNLRHMLNGEGAALLVRRGDVVAEILGEVHATEAEVLAVGYHRGGPPAVVDVGSVARRLTHAAPCAVLTIPL